MYKKLFVLFVADNKKYKDWSRFQRNFYKKAGANFKFENLIDVAAMSNSEDEQVEKLISYITDSHKIIVVSSAQLKECIENGTPANFQLTGQNIRLDGSTLRNQFERDDVRRKIVIVSLDENEGRMNVPSVLSECSHFNKADTDVFNLVMSFIVSD